MSRLTEEQKREIHYSIYDEVFQDERISLTSIARNLGLARNTVTSHFTYMIENEILRLPTMRLKMFRDLREYMYYLNFEKPLRVYHELASDSRVVYHCLASGAFDMVVLTNTPVDFENHPSFKNCILSGPRSNYSIPHIARVSYEEAFQRIKKAVEDDQITPSKISMEFPPQKIEWTELEWMLFYDLKYNMRRTFTEIVKKHGISKWLFYRSYERIKENIIKLVAFYPCKQMNYSDFFFVFKTDYEESLTELFMQLPCISMITKVDDYVAAWLNIIQTLPLKDFFGFLHWMSDHGYVENMMYALPVYGLYRSSQSHSE